MVSKLKRGDALAVSLLVLYTVVFSWLMIGVHDGFRTPAVDLGKFDQAIWNTAHGRPYQITLGERSVLQSHFSPALALFAPLFWLCPDIRLLLVLQALSVAGAGFLLYWYYRASQPWLGLGVYLAYLMHPAVHQVTLVGFHRLTLAIVTTSFILYCLLKQRHGWMIAGLVISLLCREDMAFTWVAIGLYVAFLHRSPKIGLPLFLAGVAYVVLIPFVVLPALSGSSGYGHAQVNFSYLGSTLDEIARSLISQPRLLLRYPLRPERLLALWRFLWPTVFAFALAPGVALLTLPYLAYLLSSSSSSMGQLRGWYPSIILVFLFWAVALGLSRVGKRWQRLALGLLLVGCFSGWLLYSQLWPGPGFSAAPYRVTAHDRQVEAVLRQIPVQEVVAAQDNLVPHLSHRPQIHLFPWMPPREDVDLFAFDRQTSLYPLSPDQYQIELYKFLAAPEYDIACQIDDFYLFRPAGAPVAAVSRHDSWGDTMALTGYSVTLADAGGSYRRTTSSPTETAARVELFWRLEQPTDRNYAVAVHLVDPQGRMVAQHDGWPADGQRPTATLAPASEIRDIHYLSWVEPVSPDDLSLRIGLYDAVTQEPLLLPDGQAFVIVPLTAEGQQAD